MPMIHQVRMYCGLNVKINTRETSHGALRSWRHFVCVYFCVPGRQSLEDPQFKACGWWRHYMRRHTRSGISLVYLWRNQCITISEGESLNSTLKIIFSCSFCFLHSLYHFAFMMKLFLRILQIHTPRIIIFGYLCFLHTVTHAVVSLV